MRKATTKKKKQPAKAAKKTPQTASKKPAEPRYWTRGESGIHRYGLFAARDIPKGTRVIEYVGHKLTKEEGYERAMNWMEKAKGTDKGAVYIFEVSKKWDIDGNVPWNPARLINHSCDPNCEPHVKKQRIWITAKRRIKEGEELSYDYGYDLDYWDEHPCRCGSKKCIGYIVGSEHRKKLRKILKKAAKKDKKKEKKRAKSKK
jgi:SET domain-containing protein